jgi:hypothetical protein
LQQQLQQLIAALSTWSSQLKTELSLQQQLIDLMQQLEQKLDCLQKTDNPLQNHPNNSWMD